MSKAFSPSNVSDKRCGRVVELKRPILVQENIFAIDKVQPSISTALLYVIWPSYPLRGIQVEALFVFAVLPQAPLQATVAVVYTWSWCTCEDVH